MRVRSWCLGVLLGGLGTSPVLSQTPTAGAAIEILADGSDAMRPAWSPDGAQLAFTRASYEGLWVVEADGQNIRQLSDAPAVGFGFSWAPAGDAILVRTARYDGLRRFHTAAVIDVASGETRALTAEQTSMPSPPRWAGAHHALVDAPGGLQAVAVDADARTEATAPVVRATPSGLAVTDPSLGTERLVLPSDVPLLNVTPSPDGQRVAFEKLGGNLFVVSTDGSGLVDLGSGARPTWSPDGQWVAFQRTEDDGYAVTASDLVVARADGSARSALTQTTDRLEMNPSWSPDGRRIAFDDAATGALYLLPVTE